MSHFEWYRAPACYSVCCPLELQREGIRNPTPMFCLYYKTDTDLISELVSVQSCLLQLDCDLCFFSRSKTSYWVKIWSLKSFWLTEWKSLNSLVYLNKFMYLFAPATGRLWDIHSPILPSEIRCVYRKPQYKRKNSILETLDYTPHCVNH